MIGFCRVSVPSNLHVSPKNATRQWHDVQENAASTLDPFLTRCLTSLECTRPHPKTLVPPHRHRHTLFPKGFDFSSVTWGELSHAAEYVLLAPSKRPLSFWVIYYRMLHKKNLVSTWLTKDSKPAMLGSFGFCHRTHTGSFVCYSDWATLCANHRGIVGGMPARAGC